MMIKSVKKLVFLSLVLILSSAQSDFSVNQTLNYCVSQVSKALKVIPSETPNIARNINKNNTNWNYVTYKDWTSGFWPGILWLSFEQSHDPNLKKEAEKFTNQLYPLSVNPAFDHDLGFQVFCSYGNGYRLTKNPSYKKIILATADTLATLYNPKAGTILSWPREVKRFGAHNTIIDNMMNLELLFWAAKNGGDKKLYTIAVNHATTTMNNHFRNDFSAYHVVLYDTITGKKIKGVTHQGYSDASMWARGQSWAIYGFTMVYRETKDPKFLNFAENVADVYLQKLPEDLIPYWDFNDPSIPVAPKDASAAAVTASALLELSGLVKDKNKAKIYRFKAERMIKTLSSSIYQSRDKNNAFLLHSTGNKPSGGEIDASIIYADYYYMEALLRLKKLQTSKSSL